MTVPALDVDGVSYAYGPRRALENVSLSVPHGQVTNLLGPNGAGKTTLFSLLTRLFESDAGSIRIEGRDLKKTGAPALAPLGIVFQQLTLDLDLTVMQNLHYYARLRGLPKAQAKVAIARELDRLGVADRGGDRVRSLNGGHRRRVEIARALIAKPTILVLDEPTVGLDVATRAALVDYVHGLAAQDGLAVLWATHLIDEVRPQDRLVVLDQGRVVASGLVPEVLMAADARDLAGAFTRLTGGSANSQASGEAAA